MDLAIRASAICLAIVMTPLRSSGSRISSVIMKSLLTQALEKLHKARKWMTQKV